MKATNYEQIQLNFYAFLYKASGSCSACGLVSNCIIEDFKICVCVCVHSSGPEFLCEDTFVEIMRGGGGLGWFI